MKPLKFRAVFVSKLWGGTAIADLKKINTDGANIGESLELSALPGQETICVSEGYEGLTLPRLIEKYGVGLMGERILQRYGSHFPLLVKFIDACEPLSVQVHPDDALAQSLGMPFGKSEMWYVADVKPGASLVAGFREDVDPAVFEQLLADGTLLTKANVYNTHPGDAFYIPAGTLHSIGAGNLIIEIQQTSGATYRVYDFDRTDAQGRKRELHVAMAKRALNFNGRTDYHCTPQSSGSELSAVCRSPYFSVASLCLQKPYALSLKDIGSFVVVVCYQGAATLIDQEGNTETLCAGETLLVPASATMLHLTPSGKFAALLASV